MKKSLLVGLVVTIITTLLTSFSLSALAHKNPSGSEGWGYITFDNGAHWTRGDLLYKFEFTDSALQRVTNRSAGNWQNSIAQLSMYQNTNGIGTIKTFHNPNTVTVATGGFNFNLLYHGTSYQVEYNTAKLPYASTARNTRVGVHEFGHVLGLNHVFWKCNSTLGCNNAMGVDNSMTAMYEGSDWAQAVDYWSGLGYDYPNYYDVLGAKTLNGWN